VSCSGIELVPDGALGRASAVRDNKIATIKF